MPSIPTYFIDEHNWYQQVERSQAMQPFGHIVIDGHLWVGAVEVHVCLFEKGWDGRNSDPP
jgi:hypothetical protein